jgi:16S rRNA (cytosine1402-N4)-methyltransferase
MPGTPNAELRTRNLVHITVLLRETVDLLRPRSGGTYVDGTLGGGGHAEEILRRSGPDGRVIGLDQDGSAVERSRVRLSAYGERAVVRQANFREVGTVLAGLGAGGVDGAVLDLGLSWFHLDSPDRGFSFLADGPLDMRMDARSPVTAADLVNSLPRRELTRILREYGEEPRANFIAKAIERARDRGPITNTVQLAQIVAGAVPAYHGRRIHPATLTFQALRIAVNDELGALRDGLGQLIAALRPGGRIAVIAFHSLEDRIVKRTFAEHARGCICPRKLPLCRCGHQPDLSVLTRRPVIPSDAEIASNPAARSAKLRAAEKLASAPGAGISAPDAATAMTQEGKG